MSEHRHLDPEVFAAALPGPWAHDARRALTALQDALTPAENDETCPVCIGTAAISDHGPGLLDRFAETAAGLARTLREASDSPAQEEDPRTAPTRPVPPPTTVRIEISD